MERNNNSSTNGIAERRRQRKLYPSIVLETQDVRLGSQSHVREERNSTFVQV